jgi:predicted nuclease of restriction endonuclease-like (RecB) superfamily
MRSDGKAQIPEENLAQPVRESGEAPMEPIPAGYPELLEDVKRRVSEARIRATLSVNRELITLYWGIGRLIVQRQKEEGWGKSVIARLSHDLKVAFPDARGFSASNIWRMRAFYLAHLTSDNLAQPVREDSLEALPQPVAETPWGHNISLIEKVKHPEQRLWYAAQTIEHGWSRAVLVHQIESALFERQGKALTNFERALPAPQSDLARELVKDPYNLDFLGLSNTCRRSNRSRPRASPQGRFGL